MSMKLRRWMLLLLCTGCVVAIFGGGTLAILMQPMHEEGPADISHFRGTLIYKDTSIILNIEIRENMVRRFSQSPAAGDGRMLDHLEVNQNLFRWDRYLLFDSGTKTTPPVTAQKNLMLFYEDVSGASVPIHMRRVSSGYRVSTRTGMTIGNYGRLSTCSIVMQIFDEPTLFHQSVNDFLIKHAREQANDYWHETFTSMLQNLPQHHQTRSDLIDFEVRTLPEDMFSLIEHHDRNDTQEYVHHQRSNFARLNGVFVKVQLPDLFAEDREWETHLLDEVMKAITQEWKNRVYFGRPLPTSITVEDLRDFAIQPNGLLFYYPPEELTEWFENPPYTPFISFDVLSPYLRPDGTVVRWLDERQNTTGIFAD